MAPRSGGYVAGAAGNADVPTGKRIRHVWAVGAAAATVAIQGGAAIPVPAGAMFGPIDLDGLVAGVGTDVVFTNTTAFYVGYEG